MEVLPQAIDVNEPHVPESNCNRICEGADEIVIVSEKDCATNLYHTSYVAATPQLGAFIVVAVNVAPNILPAVFAHAIEEVKRTEPAQRLLGAAGSVIHILNVPFTSGSTYTRT